MSATDTANDSRAGQRATAGGAMPLGAFTAAIAGGPISRATRAFHARGDSPRSGQPVWRNSYSVGQIERRLWKPINGGTNRGGKRWTAALLKAAKQFEIRTRAETQVKSPGARNGALGPIGIAVLEYLFQMVDYATGRLDPAIRRIADEVGHSYDAVHKALCRLRKHGFIQWIRRSEPVEQTEPGGPMVKQATNAYALLCPRSMQNWLARLIGKPPAPECDADRRKRERADFDAMLDQMSMQERLDATWNGSSQLGETLKRIAALVEMRDLHDRESCRADETGGSF